MDDLVKAEFVALREKIAEIYTRMDRVDEFRGAMADQAARFVQRAEFDLAKDAGIERSEANRRNYETRLESELRPLRAVVEAQGRPNWPLLGTFASLVIALCAGFWLILGLQIDAHVAPVARDAATAMTETSGLKLLFGQISDRIQALRTEAATSRTAAVEVETQLCAADTIRNLTHASDQRIQSMLWKKVFAGSDLPTDNTFFPRVGRCALPGAAAQ